MINRRLLLAGSVAVAGSLAMPKTGLANRKRPARQTNLTQFVTVLAYDSSLNLVQTTTFGFQARTEPRNAKYLQRSPRPILLGVVFHPSAVWVDIDFWPGVRRQINLRGYRVYSGARRVLVPSKPQGRKLVKLTVLTQELWRDLPERRFHGSGRPDRWIRTNRRGWGPSGADLSAQSYSPPDAPPDRSKLIPISSLQAEEQ